MIDVEMIRNNTDLLEVVQQYVGLKKQGAEWVGRCPFHDERTPSFTVSPSKGFVHCFGCGAHHNVIGFVMHITGASFVEACERLGARTFAPGTVKQAKREQRRPAQEGGVWIPVYPVPEDAPIIEPHVECAIFNPKRGRHWSFRPSRADAYRDQHGRLMGYVLRTEIRGDKITPTVTWCIGPDGSMQWCVRPFGYPRPLCGLDELARKPLAPVLVVEGEKCRDAGARALPMYAVITWPGGSKGLKYADWSPIAGRDVVLWPDADDGGRKAMLGYEDYTGLHHPGVAQLAWRASARSLRFVDVDGQPKGWDIADALDPDLDGWTAKQLATWAAFRVKDVEVATRSEAM